PFLSEHRRGPGVPPLPYPTLCRAAGGNGREGDGGARGLGRALVRRHGGDGGGRRRGDRKAGELVVLVDIGGIAAATHPGGELSGAVGDAAGLQARAPLASRLMGVT